MLGAARAELSGRGHTVTTLDLPGHGDDPTPVADVTLDAYAEKICATLAEQPEPVVLVGHSMGGMAITRGRRPGALTGSSA